MNHNCNTCKCNVNLKDSDEQILQELKNHRDNIDELIDEFEVRIAKNKKEKMIKEAAKILEDDMDLLKEMRKKQPFYTPHPGYTTKISYPMWFRM